MNEIVSEGQSDSYRKSVHMKENVLKHINSPKSLNLSCLLSINQQIYSISIFDVGKLIIGYEKEQYDVYIINKT